MAAEVISREAPKARGPDISHNEGAHVIDALSHCEHGERRPDPGPGRQAVADWAQGPKRWMALDRRGETLENCKGRGRKTAMSRVAKIVKVKSVLKRHQSKRSLARKLTGRQYPVSKSAVHRYLRHCLQKKPLKLSR